MHCHVLGHMMGGMMGSLLIVEDGDEANELPAGVTVPPMGDAPALPPSRPRLVTVDSLEGTLSTANGPLIVTGASLNAEVTLRTVTIVVEANALRPADVTIGSGTEVTFEFRQPGHTVTTSQVEPPV